MCLNLWNIVALYETVFVSRYIQKILRKKIGGDRVPQPPTRKILKKSWLLVSTVWLNPPSFVAVSRVFFPKYLTSNFWEIPPFSKSVKSIFPKNGGKKSRFRLRYTFSMLNLHSRAKFWVDTFQDAPSKWLAVWGTFWVFNFLKIPQKYNYGRKKCKLLWLIKVNVGSLPNVYKRRISNRSRGIRLQSFVFRGFSPPIVTADFSENLPGCSDGVPPPCLEV